MTAYTSTPVIDPDALSYTTTTDMTANWSTFTAGSDELIIDYTNKKIALVVVNNLSTDGVTIKCVYSKLKEVWKDDTTLIKFPFPMGPITDEQFELLNGWDWYIANNSGVATQTTVELLRTGGWSLVDTNGNVTEQYAGVISLGTFVDNTDQAYFQRASAGTYTAATNIKLTNPVNQAVKILEYEADTTAGASSGTTATVTVTGTYAVGDVIFVSGVTPAGYNGTYTVTAVGAGTINYTTAGSNIGAITVQGRVYYDWRSYFKVFVREQGKTYSQSQLSDIGVTQLTYQAYRFPVTNSTDLKITNSDGLIVGATVSTASWVGGTVTVTTTENPHGFQTGDEVVIAGVTPSGYNGTYTITVTSATQFTYALAGDPGSYTSGGTIKGASTDSIYAKIDIEYLRDANGDLYNIIGVVSDTTYAIGDVVQEDNGAGSRWFECTTAGTVTGSTGVAQGSWGGTAVFVAYTGERLIGTSYYAFSVIVDADTDVATTASGDALRAQVYEKIQWYLRQNSDIDASTGNVIGKTADTLLYFVGDTLITQQGVYVDSFNTQDQNDIEFYDYNNVKRVFPFVSTLTLAFNDNLKNDTAAKYWVFFTTTPNSSNFGTVNALLVDSVTQGATQGDTTMTGTINNNSSVLLDFDYDNNVQGGRTIAPPGNVNVTAVAIGLNTGQYVTQTGTIAKTKTNSISLVAPLERNYSNPA